MRAIPRILRTTALKTVAVVRNIAGSPEIHQLGSRTLSSLTTASRKSSKILKTTALSANSSLRKGFSSIKIRGLKPIGKSLTTTVPREVSRIARSTKSVTVSLQRKADFSARIHRIRLAGASLKISIPRRTGGIARSAQYSYVPPMKSIDNGVPKVAKVDTTIIPQLGWEKAISPVEQNPTSALMKVPISEIRSPVMAPSGISHELARAVNDFSKLPLWLTMPMLFASSFVLGAIVSFLIK